MTINEKHFRAILGTKQTCVCFWPTDCYCASSWFPFPLNPRPTQSTVRKIKLQSCFIFCGWSWTPRKDSNQSYRHAEMINHNFLPFSYQQSAISILPRETIIFPHVRAFLWILKFLHLSSNKVHVSSHTYSKHSEPSRNFKNIVSK